MLIELWKTLPDIDGYEVSSFGNIRRTEPHPRCDEGRLMKLWESPNGYIFVVLRINKKRTNRYVHRLVAQAFVENPLSLQETNHINGCKSDNSFWNLEWSNRSKNNIHKTRVLKKGCGSFRITAPCGTQEEIKNLTQYCEEKGLSRGMANHVLSGRNSTHKGYKFERIKEIV